MKQIVNISSLCTPRMAIVLLLLCIFASVDALSQVGINNPSPSAVLDLKSDSSGLLVPRMSAFSRRSISNPANSLIVFDQDDQLFYFFDANYGDVAAQWTGLGLWRFRDDLSDLNGSLYMRNLYGHYSLKNVGIGTQNPTHKLDVIGNVSVGDSVATVTENSMYVSGTIIADADVETNDTARAVVFEGYGMTPLGGILMWSGNPANLPDGWALCDGSSTYSDHNGVTRTVPNLSGRFIVGIGKSVHGSTTYSLNNSGGEETHVLSTAELPAHNHDGVSGNVANHTHSYNDYTVSTAEVTASNFDEQGINGRPDNVRTTGSAGGHTHTIANSGSSNAHENRPPYYALAYIIRVR